MSVNYCTLPLVNTNLQIIHTHKQNNMDSFKNMMGGGNSNQQVQQPQQGQSSSGGGFMSGFGEKLNGAAGGGRESEKNEDYLDKGTLQTLYY